MKKLIFGTLLCALTPFLHAQENNAPVNSVLQLFSCNLNPGQDADDVWSVLRALSEVASAQNAATQSEGIGIFLWTPFRGTFAYDYIWGSTSTDLVSMMDGMTTYMGSEAAQKLAARFQALNERCDSAIAMSEQMKVSSEPFDPANAADRKPDGLVETYSCKIRSGSTMADIRSATAFWQEQVKKVASPNLDKYAGYLVTPFRGGSGEADFGWIGTYPDMMSFGRGESDFINTKEGQAANARFEKASSCRSALWTGYWVMAPSS